MIAKTRPFFAMLILVVCCLLQLGGSCASDGGKNNDDRNTGDYNNDGRPNRIPRHADMVREGTGKLKWTADTDGTFYVYDKDKDFVPYEGPVRRGDEIVVQPSEDKVYVAQRVVYNENLRKDGKHQVWFISGHNQGSSNNSNYDQNQLPHDAERLVSGRGNVSIDAARHAGTIYVYDEDDRRVRYSSPIDKGNSFQIFPGKSTVNLNSKRVATVQMREGHQFSLYYRQ